MLIHPSSNASSGLTADVYDILGQNEAPILPQESQSVVSTTVPNISFDWGIGSVLGGPSEDAIVIFRGYITSDIDASISFATDADDGTRLYIDGALASDDWVDKGGGGSISAPIQFQAWVSKTIELHYYENGGGARVILFWDKNGYFETVPSEAFSLSPQSPPEPPKYLNAPESPTATLVDDKINVSWSSPQPSNTDVERYAIFWSYDNFQTGFSISSTTNQAIINNVPDSTTVYIKIRSDNDSLSVYSQPSETIEIQTGTFNADKAARLAAEAAEKERLRLEAEAAEAARIAAAQEAARIAAEQEAARIEAERQATIAAAEAERKKREAEEAAKKAEEERLKKEAEEKARLEEEARKAEEERLKKEAEEKAKAEEEARIKAEEEAKAKSEEEARIKAEEEAKAKAEEEARIKAEEEAKAEAERKAKEEAEAKAKLEEEKKKAEEEAKAKEQAEKIEAAKPENVISNASSDGVISQQEKTEISNALVNAYADAPGIPASEILASGIDYEDLPPDTPIQLENGVVLTAEIVDALQVFENPSEIFSDPGKALKAFANVGADMSPEVREKAEDIVVVTVIVGQIVVASAIIRR